MTYSCSISEQRFRGFSPATPYLPHHREISTPPHHRPPNPPPRITAASRHVPSFHRDPYPIEVHLLLGQTYLDPASWDELIHSRGPAVALRRARFAPRYDRLLRRLEEAITRYERP